MLSRFQGDSHGSEGEACLGALDPSEFSTNKRRHDAMKAMKNCKDCGPQPLENFGTAHGRPNPRCRGCHRIFRRQYGDGSRRKPQQADELLSPPFVAWLQGYVDRAGGVKQACQRLDVAERIVYRWTHTPSPFVPETTVDRFFCAAGEPYLLRELYYHELYEGLAA